MHTYMQFNVFKQTYFTSCPHSGDACVEVSCVEDRSWRMKCVNGNSVYLCCLPCCGRALFQCMWGAPWGWWRKHHCLHFRHVSSVNYLWYFTANGAFCSVFVNNEFFMRGHLCLWSLCRTTGFLNMLHDKIAVPVIHASYSCCICGPFWLWLVKIDM